MALALLCFVGSAASAHAASSGPQSWTATAPQATTQFAIADFDGDKRPDLAIVQAGQSSSLNTRYWIGFQLSSGSRQTVWITAPTGGLQITSRDVNGDSFLDVIVTTAWTNQPVAVLLNDGHGNFTRSDPSAFPSAFQSSEAGWIYTTVEIKDATAILLSRYFAGDCEPGNGFSLHRNMTGLFVPWTCHDLPFSPVVSFLGRAPPPSVLHF
jgi:hypothetical protein